MYTVVLCYGSRATFILCQELGCRENHDCSSKIQIAYDKSDAKALKHILFHYLLLLGHWSQEMKPPAH